MSQDIPGGSLLENPFLSNDSIVALQIDTKNRIDKLNGQVTDPIPYPMPSFSGPREPSQQQLLDHNYTAGSIGNSFLLGDKRAGNIAAQRIRYKSSAYNPAERGFGLTEQFEYDPVMDKYINGKFGYDPYIGIAANENIYYNDYLSKSIPSRIFSNIGVGLGRFTTSIAAKLVATVGYLGSMIGNGVQELFDPTGNNAMADIANNSLSRWAEVNWEESWKNSAALSVFKPENWEKMGYWEKMGHGAFWTDEVADGAAFMGEMILTTYLTGGVGELAGLGKVGATGINTAAKLGKYGVGAARVGKAIDWTLKIGTGADDVAGIGRWALLTTSESAVESANQYRSIKDDLKQKRRMGLPGFENMTDAEIERQAGDAAAVSFRGNMTVLAVSNAIENRLIWNKVFKKARPSESAEWGRARPGNIQVNTTGKTMEELGKASYGGFKYSNKLGKFFDWKNGLGRARFYGWIGLRGYAVEGLWEENAQLAIERLSADANYRSLGTGSQLIKLLSKTGKQAWDATTGKDVEASTAIGLGALIGLGGGAVVTKAFGGEKFFRGERRQAILDTKNAIEVYEENRAKMFSFFNIWKRKDGKFVRDENGNLEFDPVAAEAVLSSLYGNIDHLSKIDEIENPAIRQHMMDTFMQDFVYAAKKAGIFERSLASIEAIKNMTPEEVLELGFDPSSQVDHTQVVENLQQTGKEYDEVYNNTLNKKYVDKQDRIDEEKRKYASFREKGMIRSVEALRDIWNSELDELLLENIDFENLDRSRSDIREINSIRLELISLEQYENEVLRKLDSKFLSTFIEQRKQKLKERLDKLMSLYEQDIKDGKLSEYDFEGVQILYAGASFVLKSFAQRGRTIAEADIIQFISASKKLGEFQNAIAKFKYVDGLLDVSNKDSLKNYREYQKFYNEIQEKIQVTLDEERILLIKRQIEELKAKDTLTDEEKKVLSKLEEQEKALSKKLEEREKKKKEEEDKAKKTEEEKTEEKKTEEKPKETKQEKPLTEQEKEKVKKETDKIDYLITRLKQLSSAQKRRDEAKFSLDQLDKELKAKVDSLIANGATKEQAEIVANAEISNEDKEARDKLTQEIQLINDQEDEMTISLQSDLLKITDRELIAQRIKDLVNEERNDNLNFIIATIIDGNDILRVRYKELNAFIQDKLETEEKLEPVVTETPEQAAEETPEETPEVTAEEVDVNAEINKLREKNTKPPSFNNENNQITNISFNKEKTKVNDLGYTEAVFEGSFLDNYDFLSQGSESTVYLSKDKTHVIKISEPYSSKDETLYKNRIKNTLLKDILGNSGLQLVGYYEYNGTKNPIFRQNYIQGEILTENEVKEYLRNIKGIVEINKNFYIKYNGVIYKIQDFENNVIKDKNGKIIPIDLDISEVKDNNIIAQLADLEEFKPAEQASISRSVKKPERALGSKLEEKNPSYISGFLSTPNLDGSFDIRSTSSFFKEGSTIFAIEPLDDGTYALYVYKDGWKLAIQFPDRLLYPLFEEISFFNLNAKSIQTVKPAILKKENGKYVLVEKGEIDYDNVGINRENAKADEELAQQTLSAPVSNIDQEIQDVLNAKNKEELIKASEKLIGINPYDDGAVSMGVRAALLTPGSFERGKSLFLEEIKSSIEQRRKSEKAALEGAKPAEEQIIPGEKVGNFIVRQKEDGKWGVFDSQGESLGFSYNTREEAIAKISADISRAEELNNSYDEILYYNLKEIEEDPNALERIARDANGITLLQDGQLQFDPNSDIPVVTRSKYHPDVIDLANKKFPKYQKAAKDYFDSKLSKPEDPISDDIWERFTSTSNVDQDTLNSIAQKYSTDPDSLSDREKKILSAKENEIKAILNSLLKSDKLSVFPVENTEAEYVAEANFVSRHVDEQKADGLFTFVSSGPNEVVMDKDKPSIVDNVVQTRNTEGNQTSVYRRHRNVLDKYSDRNDPNGFFSTTEDGRRRFKLKIVLANKNNEGWYVKTIAKPYLIAVIVDQDGKVVNFDDDGNIVRKEGIPLAFEFQMGEYSSIDQKNGVPHIFLSRSSIILGDESRTITNQKGRPVFEEIYEARVKESKESSTPVNFDPVGDLSKLIFSGVEIFANFDTVLNSKLSSSTVNNKFSVSANQNVDSSAKTLSELIQLGFIGEDIVPEIGTLNISYFTDAGGQNIKTGAPYISIPNTTIKVPLFGKKIKDITIDGNRVFQSEDGKEIYTFGKVLKAIQSKDNIIPNTETSDIIYQITIDSFLQKTKDTEDSPYVVTDQESFVKMFEFLESLFYSKDVEVTLKSEDGLPYAIQIKDKRVQKTSFSEYRINMNKPKEGFDRATQQFIFNDSRFETEENEPYIFSYLSFVKDNFQTTALPAKIGEKNGEPIINFAKLNRRVIFTLEKSYPEIAAKVQSTNAKAEASPQEGNPQTEEIIKSAVEGKKNIPDEQIDSDNIDDITFEC